MNKKIIKYLILSFTIIAILGSIILLFKNKDIKENYKFNISYLPEEFINNYFKEISMANSEEEKENMVIVISYSEIKNSYGASKIVNAPNHQYILQYNSEEEKNYALEKLKKDTKIESIEENGIYTTEEIIYNSWGIEKMSLDYAITEANYNFENMGPVTVAIIDTGCDMTLFNKYYSGKIVEIYNVLEQSASVIDDENGHGTHVAGTIAEGTPNNVKILPIKVSSNGSIYYTDIIAAINYVVRYEKADVINMSFGGYDNSNALNQALESAKAKNIIGVAAAGNEHTDKKHYPSSFDNTIAISSVDSALNFSTFSNYGSDITFTAPGTSIKSIMGKDTTISKKNGNNAGDDHEIISGTSMSTPHAASAVAILKGYNKNLTFENVVEILKDCAIDLGEAGWDKYYGNGLISFKDVVFCDGTYCDELGIYKDLEKNISNINVSNIAFTQYNYYSVTNLMKSEVTVSYTDGSSEQIPIEELADVEILNYDPTLTGPQTVTIKLENITTNIQVTNPNNYISGWEYNDLNDETIEISGYKNHNLEIKKIYIPETIDSKQVVAFADNFKFSESGSDIEFYTHLYLPSSFARIGDYSLSETNIEYVYGSDNKIEVGTHAFENSAIVLVDAIITKIEDYAFNNCYELISIKVWEEEYSWSYGKALTFGNYAFYNCKKLESIEMTAENGYKIIDNIGNYAFYNCISLSNFDLEPSSDIGNYAFYNTFLLYDINLYYANSIGNYAFYGSGITQVDFSTHSDVINESAFENCKNLKQLSFSGARIESRAFWNSGIETIYLGDAEYISEDAFAYTPMKSSNGTSNTTDNYESVYGLGIIEKSTNKLIVGYTNAQGPSNTNIPNYVTEIGNYAFTGNNNLNKITIPATVTKIGTHAFEDCYQLSDVYMLSSTINFGNDTFKRSYEGEIKTADLHIYVYKDSNTKQFVKNKNLPYRHIEPDEVIVTNYENTYKALAQVDWNSLTVKLIYNEEENREENILPYNSNISTPLSNDIGFTVSYQDEEKNSFQYNDTHFTVKAINSIGYLSTKNVTVTVEKLKLTYSIPTGISADYGKKLSEISLPSGFEWMNGNTIVTTSGNYKARAYNPNDRNNYEEVANVDIPINVIIKPIITYNSNGGTPATKEQIVEINTNTNLDANTFTKTGYKFKNWNTKIDGTGTKYNDEQVINISSDLTLYAIWEKEVVYTTKKYSFNENELTIDDIIDNTSIEEFIKNIELSEGYTVDISTNSNLITTGSITQIIHNQTVYKKFTNIVRGDINQDGKITSADYVKVKKHIMQLEVLNQVDFKYKAADVNKDNRVTSADYVKIKKHIMEHK